MTDTNIDKLATKDIVGDLNLITKTGKNLYNKTIKSFFCDMCSYISPKRTMIANEYLDINIILEALEDNSVLSLERVKERTKAVHKLLDVKDEYIIPATKDVLFRKRNQVEYVLDFSQGVKTMSLTPTDSDPFETMVALMYIRKKLTSAERGIEFTLTLSQLSHLLKRKRCYYSNVPLSFDGIHAISLDRKDSSKGYSVDNVVACSGFVNGIKEQLIDNGKNLDKLTNAQMKKMLMSFCELL